MGKAAALDPGVERVLELLAGDDEAIDVVSKLVMLLARRRRPRKSAHR